MVAMTAIVVLLSRRGIVLNQLVSAGIHCLAIEWLRILIDSWTHPAVSIIAVVSLVHRLLLIIVSHSVTSISTWAVGVAIVSIENNFRLVVLKLVKRPSLASITLEIATLAHLSPISSRAILRAVICYILSRFTALGTPVREASYPIRLFFIKTTNLIEKALFSTHRGLLLARSVYSCPLGFLRTRICIVSFLVAAKAYDSLIDKFGLWILSLNLLNL